MVGHDKDPKHAGAAQKMKAVDRTDWNLINACEKADLVVLAVPLNAVEDTLKAIAADLKPGCVITDTVSLKQPVLAAAERWLPDSVSFVGGDPLVTSDGSGPDAASADLFEASLYCITPSARGSSGCRKPGVQPGGPGWRAAVFPGCCRARRADGGSCPAAAGAGAGCCGTARRTMPAGATCASWRGVLSMPWGR